MMAHEWMDNIDIIPFYQFFFCFSFYFLFSCGPIYDKQGYIMFSFFYMVLWQLLEMGSRKNKMSNREITFDLLSVCVSLKRIFFLKWYMQQDKFYCTNNLTRKNECYSYYLSPSLIYEPNIIRLLLTYILKLNTILLYMMKI